ncbi:MAG: ATP-dependent Clp protease proteolytic subunit [Candidatus Omnitrophica bacterium]|nr:ATP-dependent Clp protease proteolytic subunit [Candidatus Omnitrophota bacterium]MCA9425893.1 ATP-dependent Clp protease proteolytic subunit [Candidatus Omnitrophota bacterium]MCB9768310.1 ATP-dependent Clp protease proteolytic subunit [Candidatus Omnitrophota bacterium]
MFFAEEEEKKNAEKKEGLGPKLLESRTILLAGQVDTELAEKVMAQLLVMDSISNDPIKMIISSNGGHVDSGMAIYDMMRFVKSDVLTIGAGWVVSIAVPIFLGAKKKHRYALPNTRFMIHQPLGGAGGPAADVRIAAQEIVKIRKKINEMIAEETGQTVEKITEDSDRDFWMNAKEALDYGLVAKVVTSMDEVK